MQKWKKSLLLSLVVVAVIFCMLLAIVPDVIYHDATEYARRTLCRRKQEVIFESLVKFHQERNVLPPLLDTLVEKGDIQKEALYCPAYADDPNIRLYVYLPENFRDPNSPVISENVKNHAGKGLRLSRKIVRPVVIETMGDGTVRIREINMRN